MAKKQKHEKIVVSNRFVAFGPPTHSVQQKYYVRNIIRCTRTSSGRRGEEKSALRRKRTEGNEKTRHDTVFSPPAVSGFRSNETRKRAHNVVLCTRRIITTNNDAYSNIRRRVSRAYTHRDRTTRERDATDVHTKNIHAKQPMHVRTNDCTFVRPARPGESATFS